MAKIKTQSRSETFEEKLNRILLQGLKQAGINAKIEIQPVRATRLHRVSVISRQFENLRPSERQDLVWRIVSQVFSPDEQLHISMILTLTPDELAGKSRRVNRL